MTAPIDRDRRRLLTGRFGTAEDRLIHISSAVVSAFPHRCSEVAARIAALPDTEVRHVENGKIVIVLEGRDTGAIGGRLAQIALMDGVLAANMVFEQIDEDDPPGPDRSGGESCR